MVYFWQIGHSQRFLLIPNVWGCRLHEWMRKFIHLDIVKSPKYGQQRITCFLNSTAKNLSLNLSKKKYTRHRKLCQLSNDTKCSRVSLVHMMEMKIVTTEAGAFGPIFGPGHLQG